MKRLLSAILSVVMIASAFFCVDLSAYATGDDDNYTIYQADYYSKNFSFDTPSFSQIYYDELRNDDLFITAVNAWETIHIATSPSYSLESGMITKKDYYKTVIFDLFAQSDSNDGLDNLLDIATNKQLSYAVSVSKVIMGAENVTAETLNKVTPEQAINLIFGSKYCSIANGASVATKIAEWCKDAKEAVDTFSKYQAIYDLKNGTREFLNYIASDSSNPYELREAASECANYFENGYNEVLNQIIGGVQSIGDFTMKIITDTALDWAWTLIVASIPGGKAVMIGAKGARALTNYLFSTDKETEAYYKLEAQVAMENAIKNSVNSIKSSLNITSSLSDAAIYMNAVDGFRKAIILGFDYSMDLLEICANSKFNASTDDLFGNYSQCMNLVNQITNYKINKESYFKNFENQCLNGYKNKYFPDYDFVLNGVEYQKIPVESISLSLIKEFSAGISGYINDYIKAEYSPSGYTEITMPNWESSNEDIIKFIPDYNGFYGGSFEAVSNGECTITCSLSSGVSQSITINVGEQQDEEEHDYYSDFKYRVNSDGTTATITKYIGDLANVIIPSSIDGYKVTELGYYTKNHQGRKETYNGPFIYGVFENNETIQTIYIPDSVEIIGNYTFCGCSNLREVQIPYGVTRLGYGCFYGCSSLQNINIPDSVCSIGERAFCFTSIESIEIPDSVYEIGGGCFYYCTQLKKAVIGSGVTDLPFYAPMTYDNSGELCAYKGTFENCISLETLELKGKNIAVKYKAFYNCENLQNLDIHVSQIQALAFCGCDSLKTVRIDSDTRISFSNSYPEEYYGEYSDVFDGSSIETLYLPHKFYSINYGTFSGCKDTLKDLYYNGSESTWKSINQDILPQTVTVHFCEHSNMNVLKVIEPSCTEDGYTLYECVSCSEEVSQDFIPATGHNYVNNVCVNCGENCLLELGQIKTVTIDCEEKYKYYYFTPKESNYYTFYSMGECDVIGVLLDENFEFIIGDYTEDTNNFSFTHYCESGKQYILLCTMSDQNSLGTFQITIEQHVHSYNKTFVEPTCTEDGYTIYSCSCGDSFTSDYVSATGHNFVDNICINCGLEKPNILGTLEINVSYKLNVSDDLGYYYYFSTGDNSIFDITYPDSECQIAFFKTDVENTFYKDCSVFDSGSIALENNSTYIVRIVTYGDSELTISNHQHHYTKVVYEPTCTSEGYTNYICDCAPGYSSSYSDDFVEALGHNYVDDICTRCGITKSDYEYELLDDGTISITQYTGAETEVVVPATIDGISVKEVSYSAFNGCETVKSVTFSEGIEAIYCSFSNCPALETIYIPSTVSDFELVPFSNEITFESGDNNENFVTEVHSGNLKNISVSNDNPYFCSVDGVLFSKNMDTLIRYPSGKSDTVYEIPNTVKSFSSLAFAYAGNLSSIIIPESVENIQNELFYLANNMKMGGYGNIIDIESKFKGFEVNANNENYCSVDGVLYSKDMGTLIAYPNGKTDEDFVINDQVEKIGMMAFAFTQVKNIKLSNVQTIYHYAFYQCGFLETVEFSDNCKSIGYYSFAYCSSLEEINIPAGITFDGGEVFTCCINLKKVSLPIGLEEIGSYTFIYCINLSEIFIPSSVKNISPSAFTTCDNLKTVYYSGSQAQWNNISIGTDNSCLTDATIYYNSSGVDKDTLVAAIEMFDSLDSADYSTESYSNLSNVVEEYRGVIETAQTQQEIDEAVTAILEAMYDLVPNLNLNLSAENGSYEVQYDSTTSSDSKYSLLFGTEVTLTAKANDGYKFVGWYDETSGVYLSKDSTYIFKITANTNIKAVFVEEQSATLTFTTYSNWVKEEITKTVDEWNEMTSIEDLLPDVPYRYGYSNGRWVYDNDKVLAKLRAGENVSIVAEYDADDTSLPTPPTSNGDVPVLDLYYKLDADENIGSFVMATGIPENCQIESVGMAFYYKNANQFNPENFELLLNNKMLTNTFELDDSNIYIANIERFTSKNNWAARGYITYYDADGNLKTVYSNQINIVGREQV